MLPLLSDSHCHLHMLDLKEFSGSLDSVLEAAKANGVGHFLCVGTRLEDTSGILEITKRYAETEILASLGLHPNEVVEQEPSVDELLTLASDPKIVAIGETGLDYYRTEEQQSWQMERFRTHVQAAKRCNKPLVIHTRSARQDTLRILREEGADTVGGVFHCFTEDWETAKQALELGFYISFSGILTFKNAVELQSVAKQVPLDRILIETDTPYLAPVPYRGKMNQPAYVKHVAEFLASLRGESFEKIAEQTTKNYLGLFYKPTCNTTMPRTRPF